ncbi:MAG TPA: helix-turn-helix transcriptional regulator [Flavisolibacter sp.]|nr:helix-turn-helix transcriptional regulator [Flavisolibacter sp.]
MKNKKTARKYSSPIVAKLLSELTPAEELQHRTKATLAARLDDLINARGWGKSEFAERANKNPSEITKWLSGTHNFTVETLAEIALALDMPVAELFAPKQIQVVNKIKIVVTVKEVEPSIKYVTPMGHLVSGSPNYFSGEHHGVMFPLTTRMHQA